MGLIRQTGSITFTSILTVVFVYDIKHSLEASGIPETCREEQRSDSRHNKGVVEAEPAPTRSRYAKDRIRVSKETEGGCTGLSASLWFLQSDSPTF